MFANRLTEILGTQYPLILGPMRRITLGSMAAAVSNSGAFGQVATGLLRPADLRREIELACSLTQLPFGVNIPLIRKEASEYLEIAIDLGVPVISTSAGRPGAIVEKAKRAGMKVLHKVSSVSQGLQAQAAGVDAVVAMGYEAGGHVGREKTTTFCLVPQLVDALRIPVVAAGGLGDGRGFLAALALGAEGVEMGTRFLATRQCPIPAYYKQALLAAPDDGTFLLGKKAMPVRVLRNDKSLRIQNPNHDQEDAGVREQNDTLDYIDPKSDADKTLMMAGQIAGLLHEINELPEVVQSVMNQAAERARSLAAYFRPSRPASL
ncbi:MAG: nitronate monooxygenase [Desulfarculus sp.]|nr:nitronate monooxygenase [Pseudomonadota bacterium]MBV1717330.1 nitronate monooxygenase [Desulfarculus sp.]MBU4573769.1 nitronate monooxygenase [Pseudomonadota bacterium]MBU4596917.1 nitronate monooxygenase [Pseudomonadota bacterium]MBV1739566.1 nitronate monooxygenase [Desulfarculus sp.]